MILHDKKILNNMNKYYYKFPADTHEGKQLRSFHRAAMKAEREAERYAKRVGALAYYEDPNGFAGGVGCVTFKEGKKVNPNVWRFVGKQEETDERLYMPNARVTAGSRMLKAGETVPRDSARRIWQDVKPVEGDGERMATYLDIAPAITDAPRADREAAVQAERWRLKLPVVRLSSFYQIVHADLTTIDGTQAPKKIQERTPVFFFYHGCYYIGLDHPIHHDGFEEINQYTFNTTKRDLLFEEKMKTEKDDLDD